MSPEAPTTRAGRPRGRRAGRIVLVGALLVVAALVWLRLNRDVIPYTEVGNGSFFLEAPAVGTENEWTCDEVLELWSDIEHPRPVICWSETAERLEVHAVGSELPGTNGVPLDRDDPCIRWTTPFDYPGIGREPWPKPELVGWETCVDFDFVDGVTLVPSWAYEVELQSATTALVDYLGMRVGHDHECDCAMAVAEFGVHDGRGASLTLLSVPASDLAGRVHRSLAPEVEHLLATLEEGSRYLVAKLPRASFQTPSGGRVFLDEGKPLAPVEATYVRPWYKGGDEPRGVVFDVDGTQIAVNPAKAVVAIVPADA